MRHRQLGTLYFRIVNLSIPNCPTNLPSSLKFFFLCFSSFFPLFFFSFFFFVNFFFSFLKRYFFKETSKCTYLKYLRKSVHSLAFLSCVKNNLFSCLGQINKLGWGLLTQISFHAFWTVSFLWEDSIMLYLNILGLVLNFFYLIWFYMTFLGTMDGWLGIINYQHLSTATVALE